MAVAAVAMGDRGGGQQRGQDPEPGEGGQGKREF